MSKNINYYPGLTLSREELQFKDYSDKYLSLYVDLIRAGETDVMFVKEATDFQVTKGTGSPNNIKIDEGFCLFMGINESLTGFEFKDTLNISEYPDQRFFVFSEEKDTALNAGTANEVRYVYLQNYLVPAAFRCTVDSEGVISIADNGSIRKSEVPSIVRGSNSGAPTRLRFLALDYTDSNVNKGVVEVNTITSDIITVNGDLSAESGEVLCIPIGSFDLGIDNDLLNRALFAYNETRVIISNNDDEDDETGIVKVASIEFTSATEYDITDLRNDNKYIIAIDTEIDLSDFVTKSTEQVITAGKAFRSLLQGRIASLNATSHLSSNRINIGTSGSANDFIFDCESGNVTISGFYHESKSLGTNPETNLVAGTSIRVRFINVGSNSVFIATNFAGISSNLSIKQGVLYTIRLEDVGTGGALGTVPTFSLSPTTSHVEVAALDGRVEQNEDDITAIDGRVTVLEDNVLIADERITGASTNLYMSYIKKGTEYLVTVTGVLGNGASSSPITGLIPSDQRPVVPAFGGYVNNSNEKISIEVNSSGGIMWRNDTSVNSIVSVTYPTGISDLST